jgi:hypothetical protein
LTGRVPLRTVWGVTEAADLSEAMSHALLVRLCAAGDARATRLRNHQPLRVAAEICGVSPGCISRWEGARRIPRAGVAARRYGAYLAGLLALDEEDRA